MIRPPGSTPLFLARRPVLVVRIGHFEREEVVAARVAADELVEAFGRAEIAFALLVPVGFSPRRIGYSAMIRLARIRYMRRSPSDQDRSAGSYPDRSDSIPAATEPNGPAGIGGRAAVAPLGIGRGRLAARTGSDVADASAPASRIATARRPLAPGPFCGGNCAAETAGTATAGAATAGAAASGMSRPAGGRRSSPGRSPAHRPRSRRRGVTPRRRHGRHCVGSCGADYSGAALDVSGRCQRSSSNMPTTCTFSFPRSSSPPRTTTSSPGATLPSTPIQSPSARPALTSTRSARWSLETRNR